MFREHLYKTSLYKPIQAYTPIQVYDRDCLLLNVKHRGKFFMAWAAVSWFSADLMVNLVGRIIEEKYRKVFATRSIL